VSSAENKARSGMPSLDPTIEIGPEFTWTLWKGNNGLNTINFEIPIRQGIAVEFFRAKGIGQFTVPYLAYAVRPSEQSFGFFGEATIAAMFATQQYHDYFYGVGEKYATPTRPAYQAKGGYSGVHASLFTSRKVGQFYAFAFIRHDRLEGTAFEDSPLVKTKHYWAMGGGLIWYFFQSKALGHDHGDR
jgi:hypothetical protein